MAFEPLGYRFEVRSTETPAAVKARLRGKMTSWFNPQLRARGWIVGPFLCLWQSAINQYGPMVLARIRPDGDGTIITGRAGSDLNGTVWCMLVFLIALFAMVMAVIDEKASTGAAFIVVVIIILFMSPIMWFSHIERKDAEALVSFVQHTLGVEPERRERSARAARAIKRAGANELPVPGASLVVDGVSAADAPAAANVIDAIEALDMDGFIILSFANEAYMQAAEEPKGFRLEYRDGGPDKHFRTAESIGRDAVALAMLHYLATRRPSPELRWEPVRFLRLKPPRPHLRK